MHTHEGELCCPLTLRKDVELTDVISVSELIKVYKEFWNWDVSGEFGEVTELRRYYTPAAHFWFFDPPVTASPSYYAHLSTIMPYQETKHEFDVARTLIKETDRVFEFGCGEGHFSKYISCVQYTGIELNSTATSLAIDGGLDVRNFCGSYVPKDSKYDVICAFQVLEHLAEPAVALASWVDALEPGGRLILGLPNCDSFVSIMINNCLNLPPHHVTWWTPSTLQFLPKLLPIQVETIVAATAAEDGTELAIAQAYVERCIFELAEGHEPPLVSAVPNLLKYRTLRDVLAEQLLSSCCEIIRPMTAHTMIAVLHKLRLEAWADTNAHKYMTQPDAGNATARALSSMGRFGDNERRIASFKKQLAMFDASVEAVRERLAKVMEWTNGR